MHPDANFAGLYEVSNSGVKDLLGLGETCQDDREQDGEKKLCMYASNVSGDPAMERACQKRNDWRICLSRTSYVSCPCVKLPVCNPSASRLNTGTG